MPPLQFRREQLRDDNEPHLYAVYRPDGDPQWLDRVADTYVELRSRCRILVPETALDGVDVVDHATVQRYLTRATMPRLSSGGPLDVVRADLGELLAYELLEGEFGTLIGYKLVRDRETVNLPGRGIDAIGAEILTDAPAQGADHPHPEEGGAPDITVPRLVLTEVKVSDEAASPPQVVDRKRDGMRNQHRAHLKEHRQTTDKVWLAVRNCTEQTTQLALLRIAMQMERDREGTRVVACCVLVRPAMRVADTDCGTFRTSPSDFAPAEVRFLTVSLPADMQTTLAEWDAAIARAIDRQCGGAGGAAA